MKLSTCRPPDIDMSELESLFSAAAPPLSASAAEKLAKKAPPKQEKIHLVWPGFVFYFSFLDRATMFSRKGPFMLNCFMNGILD